MSVSLYSFYKGSEQGAIGKTAHPWGYCDHDNGRLIASFVDPTGSRVGTQKRLIRRCESRVCLCDALIHKRFINTS
ncbi:hypothetical protein SynSYN20_02021 [Synechococcus sp. SYN20]|nr:hypothetical protein SynSYN20_02021 [Synechococcus sp. SYN20]